MLDLLTVPSHNSCVKTLASFPGSPRMWIRIHGESLVSLLHECDVIEIGPEEKSTCCSTNYAFNTQCIWYSTPDSQICVVSFPLPSLFFLFWIFKYAHTQLRSLYPLSTFDAAHVRNTRLSTPAQLQCSCSREWEPGNEAMKPYLWSVHSVQMLH